VRPAGCDPGVQAHCRTDAASGPRRIDPSQSDGRLQTRSRSCAPAPWPTLLVIIGQPFDPTRAANKVRSGPRRRSLALLSFPVVPTSSTGSAGPWRTVRGLGGHGVFPLNEPNQF
jgi:hypothetical protein